ncbi:MAG: hypothetical protein G01um101431_1120 [Parcubacteria group bacterium Gr01-1014_31]|nr:MAG: hypothetical protein G01um101431_1120 [Parcubacteria group bacterium Gr01-1014_31]
MINLVIPHANYLIAKLVEVSIAYRVAESCEHFIMSSTVKFDHQPGLNAAEVRNILTDRVLTPEFIPEELPIS